MCGIAGFWTKRGVRNPEQLCAGMVDALQHRGPDQQQVWADAEVGVTLGQARLAILDLSVTGAQPMHSADGRWVITYNGEIYNHMELREELRSQGHNFRGSSDTEVALEAIAHWGLDIALPRFIGMFGAAIWDRRNHEMHLFRDHLGVKPLYWAELPQGVLFGSELKALHRFPDWNPEINSRAIPSYLRYGYIPAPGTIYRGTHKLMPGTRITLQRSGEIKEHRFWSLADRQSAGALSPLKHHAEEAVEACADLLQDAVARTMVADVPVGVLLSGGIDSSLVASMMQAHSTKPVRSFSIGFQEDGYNESVHAARIAAHLGTDHTELQVDAATALACIPKMAFCYDEPFGDASQIPTYLVSKLASQHVRVVLTGDGGDEIFGGYNRYLYANRLRKLPIRGLLARGIQSLSVERWDLFSNLIPVRKRPHLLGQKLYKAAHVLGSDSLEEAHLCLVSQWQSPESILQGLTEPPHPSFADGFVGADTVMQMQAQDLVAYLPNDILTKLDRAAMAHSLESRVPLLDHRVVEFGFRQPTAYKIRNGQSKWLMRQVLTRYVPHQLMDRPKMGFALPLERWLRTDLRDWCEDLLSVEKLSRSRYLNVVKIRKVWQDYLIGYSDANHQYRLWNILMLQQWFEEWT